jgi:hypothetical protein
MPQQAAAWVRVRWSVTGHEDDIEVSEACV